MDHDGRLPGAARLLIRILAPRQLRTEVEGDLTESWVRDRDDAGRLRARLRLYREILSPAFLALRWRAAGVDLAPGGPVRSSSRPWPAGGLGRDLKSAVRIVTRTPGFAAVVVLSLALGIGPNTALFSILNGVFFVDRGIADPSALLEVNELSRSGGYNQTYYSVYERVAEGTADVFSGVAAYTTHTVRIEDGLASSAALAELVTGNFFDVLGVGAAVGRTFLPEEGATPGTHPVAVLSARFWGERFGRDPGVARQPLRINGREYTVVGVATPPFRGKTLPGLEVDLWIPLMMYPHLSPGQMSRGDLHMSARLREGVEPATAMAAVQAVGDRIDEERGDSRYRFRLGSFIASDYTFDPNFDTRIGAMAALLLGVVGIVLLVACVNLAGFFLARSTDRRREMSIRVAMGAGSGTILRQLLVESLLLAVMGGLAGLAIGVAMVGAANGLDLPLPAPVDLNFGLDARVLGFTAFITVGAGLVFGLAPALRAARSPVASVLRDEAASALGGKGKTRARGFMVGGQVALSMVLLVGAGLFLQSLLAAAREDVGFSARTGTIMEVDAAASGREGDARASLYHNIEKELAALPEVEAVGSTYRLPLGLGNVVRGFQIPGVAPPPDADAHRLELTYVSPGYFEVMGIPLVRGRGLVAADDGTSPPVVVVSQALADRFWPGEDPIGRMIEAGADVDQRWAVVGVVGNVRIWSRTEPPRPYLYFPASQHAATSAMTFVARGRGSADALARRMAEVARTADPDAFVVDLRTMEDHVRSSLFLPRMAALLIGSLATLALMLAAVGLWGIVSYGVSRRTRELGVRMALGAERRRIVSLVMRGGLVSVGVGAAVGFAGAVAVARVLERFLIGVDGWDPATFAVVPIVLGGVALLAAYLPALRATRVDPVEALGSD